MRCELAATLEALAATHARLEANCSWSQQAAPALKAAPAPAASKAAPALSWPAATLFSGTNHAPGGNDYPFGRDLGKAHSRGGALSVIADGTRGGLDGTSGSFGRGTWSGWGSRHSSGI